MKLLYIIFHFLMLGLFFKVQTQFSNHYITHSEESSTVFASFQLII
jgi:hypothetical protein